MVKYKCEGNLGIARVKVDDCIYPLGGLKNCGNALSEIQTKKIW